MRGEHALHSRRCCHETEKSNTLSTSAFEGGDGGNCASARREHRVEHEELPLGRIAWYAEVVVDRLQRQVIAIETNVADARRRDESKNAVDHTESGAQDRDERELLAGYAPRSHSLEWCFNRHRLERKIAGGFVRH